MDRSQKEKAVEDFKKIFEYAEAVIVAQYKGLNSETIDDLRAKTRDSNVSFKVTKNRLIKIALSGGIYENISDIWIFHNRDIINLKEKYIKEKANQINMKKSDLIEVVIRSTRHIITTSLTTLGGFLPLIFASIFFRPLAWAMSIGVLGATMTALLYIPAMFIWMNKIKD